MKPFNEWYVAICTFSAIAAITVQNFILKHFYDTNSGDLIKFVIPLLTASVAYVLLYKGLVMFFEKKAWKWFLKEYNLEGRWYHEYASESDPDYVRRGATEVKQDLWKMNFNGRNYDKELNIQTRTMWTQTAVDFKDDDNLVVAYSAHKPNLESSDTVTTYKEGLIKVTIIRDDNNVPCRMVGVFKDSHPSNRSGVLTWWRETEWSKDFENSKL